MGTLSITRKTSNTLITASGFNTNYDEIEAVINGAIEAANIAADAVTAAKLNSDVVRTNYGLAQHTDGTLYIDLASTSGLEFSSGKLRIDVYGNSTISSNGFEVGKSGDLLLTSASSTPDGWTDVTATYSDKFIRINATALSTGGADTHTHGGTTGSHTLTSDEIPAHTHTFNTRYSDDGGNTYGNMRTVAGTAQETPASSSTGGGSGHTHTITSADNIPAYMTAKMYKKD